MPHALNHLFFLTPHFFMLERTQLQTMMSLIYTRLSSLVLLIAHLLKTASSSEHVVTKVPPLNSGVRKTLDLTENDFKEINGIVPQDVTSIILPPQIPDCDKVDDSFLLPKTMWTIRPSSSSEVRVLTHPENLVSVITEYTNQPIEEQEIIDGLLSHTKYSEMFDKNMFFSWNLEEAKNANENSGVIIEVPENKLMNVVSLMSRDIVQIQYGFTHIRKISCKKGEIQADLRSLLGEYLYLDSSAFGVISLWMNEERTKAVVKASIGGEINIKDGDILEGEIDSNGKVLVDNGAIINQVNVTGVGSLVSFTSPDQNIDLKPNKVKRAQLSPLCDNVNVKRGGRCKESAGALVYLSELNGGDNMMLAVSGKHTDQACVNIPGVPIEEVVENTFGMVPSKNNENSEVVLEESSSYNTFPAVLSTSLTIFVSIISIYTL